MGDLQFMFETFLQTNEENKKHEKLKFEFLVG